jgi:hypothetical protein
VVTFRRLTHPCDAYTTPQRLTHNTMDTSNNPALDLATATAASVQALAAALQQHSLQSGPQFKVTLPPFWPQDPVGWFQHIEAEFIIARVPLTSYLCYLHVIKALPSDVITAVRDITSSITAESLNAYEAIKQTLLERYTTSQLQKCFQLLDSPPLGDRNIAATYAQMRALIPTDGDVLFNAIFLRILPDHIRTALASKGELPSNELAAAAALLQHTVTPTAAIAAATPLPPSPTPPTISAATQRSGRPFNRSSPARYRKDTPHRRRSNSRNNRDRRRSNSNNSDSRLCWYHQQFGRRANKCDQQQCSWEN